MKAVLARASISVSLSVGLLAFWRLLYPLSDAGLAGLGALALIVASTSYRNALRRRRAWLEVVLMPSSPLSRYFRGRVAAAFAALASTLAVVPATGYFTLAAAPPEWLMFMAFVVAVVAATLAARSTAREHIREPFLSAACTPLVTGAVATVFAAIYMWLTFSVLEIPSHVDARSLSEAVLQANRELPSRDHLVAEMLALFRSVETAAWWMMNRTDSFGSSPPLILFLFLNAFVCYGLATTIASVTTFASEMIDYAEHRYGFF